MNDEEPISAKLLIEPEPTPEELVAILSAARSSVDDAPDEAQHSRWTEIGRREQLHRPLYDRRGGWNR